MDLIGKSTEILLVGTVHYDLQGPERLREILNWYKPEVITVENTKSRYSLLDQRRHSQRHFYRNNRGNIETNSLLARSFAFESWVSRDYARENGIPCLPVDADDAYVFGENIKKILNEMDIQLRHYFLAPDEFMRKIDNLYLENSDLHSDLFSWLMGRDTAMLQGIFEHKNHKILHVSGLDHINGGYNNLYDRLKYWSYVEDCMNVSHMKLCDADHL